MIRKMYSIYDKKMDYFLSPACFGDGDECKRSLSMMLMRADDKNIFKKHPYDYSVFVVGEFNDNTGLIQNYVPVKLLCEMSSLLRANEEPVTDDKSE